MQKAQNKSKKGGICAKTGALLFLMIFTLFIGVFLVPEGITNAAPTIDEVSKDCQIINKNPNDNTTMPDSFPVGRCLSTNAQRGSKFLPTIAANSASGSTESTMSAQLVIINAVDLFVKIIATLSLIVFMIGGFMAIVANGNEDLLGKGKSAMTYSAVGLGIAMLSFIIVAAVQSVFFNS